MTEKKGLGRTNANAVAYIKVAVGELGLAEAIPRSEKKGGAETWQLTEILFDASHHLK